MTEPLVAWLILQRDKKSVDIYYNTQTEYWSLLNQQEPRLMCRVKLSSDDEMLRLTRIFMDMAKDEREYNRLEVRGIAEFPGFSPEEINQKYFPWRCGVIP